MSGRGRGRGRRGRGGSGYRGRVRQRSSQISRTFSATPAQGIDGEYSKRQDYDIDKNPAAFFTGTASVTQHLEGLKANRFRYGATIAVLVRHKVQITQNARIRALAMAWAEGDKELAKELLKLRSLFGLVEVLRAVSMLDAGRQARVLEKRLKCLQVSGNKVSRKKLGALKSDIANLNNLKPPIGSASGAICKQVGRWVRGFTAEELEFYALHLPKEPWKKLADICHLNPKVDFPAAPWFLPYCFDAGSLPDNSLISRCKNLHNDSINQLLEEIDIPYSVLKDYKCALNEASKKRIAKYEKKVDTVLWYYEDLKCTGVDEVLNERLRQGDPVNLPNGKLLERLLKICCLCRPNFANEEIKEEPDASKDFFSRLIDLAEPRLTSMNVQLASPVAILGDASPSMSVAIRVSTIIASLLTAICSAKLVFFDSVNRDAPILPKTVREMLKLAMLIQTNGATSPAASLYPFYERKEVVKTFIIVTDEEENTPCEGYNFKDLYDKYYKEVYPATLVFVSFLSQQHRDGPMVTQLKAMGYTPSVLCLSSMRPDLTRLDDMFAKISATTTTSLMDDIKEAETLTREKGFEALFDSLKDSSGLSDLQEE